MVDFPNFFFKGDNFCDFLLAFLHTKTLLKRVYPKRKEFGPTGSKFFPFSVDSFSEGGKLIWQNCLPRKCISFPLRATQTVFLRYIRTAKVLISRCYRFPIKAFIVHFTEPLYCRMYGRRLNALMRLTDAQTMWLYICWEADFRISLSRKRSGKIETITPPPFRKIDSFPLENRPGKLPPPPTTPRKLPLPLPEKIDPRKKLSLSKTLSNPRIKLPIRKLPPSRPYTYIIIGWTNWTHLNTSHYENTPM